MPTPASLTCTAPGCSFTTPPGAPTWENLIALLSLHTQSAHPNTSAATPVNSSKLEKLPRPTFTLNMTESQWNFTKIQWDNYIRQTVVSEDVKLMQMQAACSEDLRQRIFDSGSYIQLNTPELFLAKMKDLAVITIHKSVHLPLSLIPYLRLHFFFQSFSSIKVKK